MLWATSSAQMHPKSTVLLLMITKSKVNCNNYKAFYKDTENIRVIVVVIILQ